MDIIIRSQLTLPPRTDACYLTRPITGYISGFSGASAKFCFGNDMYKTFTVRKFDNKINESFRMLTQSLLEQNQVFIEAKENFQF